MDTHVAIFSTHKSSALSATAKAAIARGPNVLSVVSYWEVMLKSMKGLLDVGDPRAWWQDALEQLAARPLPLQPRHVSALHALPVLHKDPFDRILLAQSIAEGMALISADAEVARYAAHGARIIL